MSKYTEAEQFFKEHDHDACLENCMENTDMSCDYCDKQRETICEALQIADRLEQADAQAYAVTKEEMREKNCRHCNRHDFCRERKRSMWCTDGIIFERGYRQALADIRGDAE